MTDKTNSDTFSDTQRERAYNEAAQAKERLDSAARRLGYDDIHQMMNSRADDGLDRTTDDGVKAITNAYLYLDNGMLEGLLDPVEDDG